MRIAYETLFIEQDISDEKYKAFSEFVASASSKLSYPSYQQRD